MSRNNVSVVCSTSETWWQLLYVREMAGVIDGSGRDDSDDDRHPVEPSSGLTGEVPALALGEQLELFALPKACSEPGCDSQGRIIMGLCNKHYQRLRKHGSTNPEGIQARDHSVKSCQWNGCGEPVKALGFCSRHYQRVNLHGSPSATKLHDVDLNAPRLCKHCGKDISEKRSNAVFCGRACKTAASDKRRLLDGRERARNRKRYPKERRKRKKQARALYRATLPRQLETSRAWRRANPEKRYAHHANRRARKYNNPGFVEVTEWEWRRMLRRNDYCCTYCGDRPATLVMDHIIPLVKGGRHAPGNVTPACAKCNGAKGSMLLIEWKLRLKDEAD